MVLFDFAEGKYSYFGMALPALLNN